MTGFGDWRRCVICYSYSVPLRGLSEIHVVIVNNPEVKVVSVALQLYIDA